MSKDKTNDNLITMSAGPNSIHDRIREAYSRQLLYHYDPSFHDLFDDTTEKLKRVYQTSGDVVIMQGEAVLGLEAASACTVRSGDKCLNLVSGVFGAGYSRYFRRYSGQDPIEINVPYEKYEDRAIYDIEGAINFESTVDVPLPIGFIDNEVVINNLDVTFRGELRAGINAPSTQATDGYRNVHSVFKKYLEQTLDDIDGTITEEGLAPSRLDDSQIDSFQHQFVDQNSLMIFLYNQTG